MGVGKAREAGWAPSHAAHTPEAANREARTLPTSGWTPVASWCQGREGGFRLWGQLEGE